MLTQIQTNRILTGNGKLIKNHFFRVPVSDLSEDPIGFVAATVIEVIILINEKFLVVTKQQNTSAQG